MEISIKKDTSTTNDEERKVKEEESTTAPTMIPVTMKLTHLPLKPSTLSNLTRKGLTSTDDVYSSYYNTLQKEQESLAKKQHESIPKEVHSIQNSISSFQSITAKSLLEMNFNNQQPIVSFVKAIDVLLGGGIQLQEVTELIGPPSVGKTQLAMQLCVNALVPSFGDDSNKRNSVLYLDCEGGFCPQRCWTMAQALVTHIFSKKAKLVGQQQKLPEWFTPEGILESIQVYRIHDDTCFLATVMALEQQFSTTMPPKLIVIDSIAFHYRYSKLNYKTRTKSLVTIAAHLSHLASKYNMAIVILNQMTTKVISAEQQEGELMDCILYNDTRLVPALGDSWAHSTTTRLLLSFDDSTMPTKRKCQLIKSPHKPGGMAYFAITDYGMRDL